MNLQRHFLYCAVLCLMFPGFVLAQPVVIYADGGASTQLL